MITKLYLGTRKGLLEAVRKSSGWEVSRLSFIGVQVPMLLPDSRDGALCVMRTRDGGATWEQLRVGLPQQHAYHLVFRHCLDVSADGRTLAFGSTTGSVWISEDGGDSWERLSAELPPVYCVRFG